MTLFHLDLAFNFLYRRPYDPKKDFSGARKVQTWMAKLQTAASSLPPTQGSSASTCSFVSTIANSNFAPSSGSQRLPMSVQSSSDGLGYRGSDLEASDGGTVMLWSTSLSSVTVSHHRYVIARCWCDASHSRLELHPGHHQSLLNL